MTLGAAIEAWEHPESEGEAMAGPRSLLEEYERDSRSLDATEGLIVQEIDESLSGRPDRESDEDSSDNAPKRRRRRV
jgi:hypothetical protein